MSQPTMKQTREDIAEDYKRTLEGLIPICEKYIETTSELLTAGTQLQNLFILLKSQSKQMIAGIDKQLELREESPQVTLADQTRGTGTKSPK